MNISIFFKSFISIFIFWPYRKKQKVVAENDIKGEKGAYFLNSSVILKENTIKLETAFETAETARVQSEQNLQKQLKVIEF